MNFCYVGIKKYYKEVKVQTFFKNQNLLEHGEKVENDENAEIWRRRRKAVQKS